MSFPRYPEYKKSGVDWLGQLPKHWEVVRLKNVLAKRITDGPHTTPVFTFEGIPFLSVDGIQNGELKFDACRYVSVEDHAEFKKKAHPVKDDLLMGKAASTGKIARVKIDFEFSIWSPLALIKVNKSEIHPVFVEYFLKSPVSQAEINVLCTSNTQKNISMDDIPLLHLTKPPLDEQKLIIEFLEREISMIDTLVTEQQKLIELLREKLQAVISHAVTKGLNPTATMKDSGVDWLGSVPEDWSVTPLKYVVSMRSGDQITSENIYDSGDYLVYGGNGLRGFSDKYTHEGHHCLIGRQGALCGNINYASGKFFASEHAIVLSEKKPVAIFYLGELLRSMNLGQYSTSAAQPGLSVEVISNLRIPLPRLDEQIIIANFLKSETEKFDALIETAKKSIHLLEERRSALISAAVTGQIDVRNFVPELESA